MLPSGLRLKLRIEEAHVLEDQYRSAIPVESSPQSVLIAGRGILGAVITKRSSIGPGSLVSAEDWLVVSLNLTDDADPRAEVSS